MLAFALARTLKFLAIVIAINLNMVCNIFI